MKSIETARLLIREMQSDDAAFIVELLNEESFIAGIGDKGVRTLENALDYIQSNGVDLYEQGGLGMRMVELVDSGVRVGICGVLKRDFLDHPDVGFAISEPHHRKGFALEAASAVIDHARTDLGYERVCGITSNDNIASQDLLEKLGLSFDRMIQKEEGGPEIRLYT